jgi:hypothetical protein
MKKSILLLAGFTIITGLSFAQSQKPVKADETKSQGDQKKEEQAAEKVRTNKGIKAVSKPANKPADSKTTK